MLLTLVSFVGVMVVLIFVHELGHFVAAKAMGVPVLEFGFGYPPRLFGRKFKGTLYSINLLPLGGFVRMPGETDPGVADSLASRSIGTRFLVMIAGSAMNLLLPVLIFTFIFILPQRTYAGAVVIEDVSPDSPAAAAGMLPGDTILRVDGHTIENTGDLSYQLHLRLGALTNWDIQRGDDTLMVSVIPRWKPPEGEGATGVEVKTEDVEIVSHRYTWWRAIYMGGRRTVEMLVLAKNEVTRWTMGAAAPVVAGPVGIAQMTGEVARIGGFMPLLEFAALLSINLAIINLLPIPMLDGGRLVFVFIELVSGGRRVPPEKEGMVHLVGFVLLISFAILITYFDILRVARGESFIPK